MKCFHPRPHVADTTSFNLSSMVGIRARFLTWAGVTRRSGSTVNNDTASVVRKDWEQMLVLRTLPNIFLGVIPETSCGSADRTAVCMTGDPFEQEGDSSKRDGVSPHQDTFEGYARHAFSTPEARRFQRP